MVFISVPQKKPRTEIVQVGREKFRVPTETAHAVLVLLKGAQSDLGKTDEDLILAEDSPTLKRLTAKYSSAGAALQGARLKEGLSQTELARNLNISQTNLSKMEHGKRPIGKTMAKRLAAALNIDYKVFL